MCRSQSGPSTQRDPIGLAGGINQYGYAGGDPVNSSDPYGLFDCPKEWEQKKTAEGDPFCFNSKTGAVADDDFHKTAEADDRRVQRDARCEAAKDHVLRGIAEDFLLGVAWATNPASGATATGAYLISRSEHGGAQYVPAVGVGARFVQEWKACTGGGS